jgi:hypothetical protein
MCSYVYLVVLKNTETHFQNCIARKKDLVYVCPQYDSSEIQNGFLRGIVLVVDYDSGANLTLYELGIALCNTRLNVNNSQHR